MTPQAMSLLPMLKFDQKPSRPQCRGSPTLGARTINDAELVHESNKVECYSPITEDISLDDEVLCNAV